MEMIQISQNIRDIRKIYVSENKYNDACLIIQHCLISLYNPVTQTYKEWDIFNPCEWIIKIIRKNNCKHVIRIVARYDSIQAIAKYLVTGNL